MNAVHLAGRKKQRSGSQLVVVEFELLPSFKLPPSKAFSVISATAKDSIFGVCQTFFGKTGAHDVAFVSGINFSLLFERRKSVRRLICM